MRRTGYFFGLRHVWCDIIGRLRFHDRDRDPGWIWIRISVILEEIWGSETEEQKEVEQRMVESRSNDVSLGINGSVRH